MKFFYKAILAIILLPSLSYAQSNYKPGYVVDLKGDTLRGFIDYREWHSNPNSINFKTATADAKPHQYTPAEITSFTIDKLETYIRYTGPVSMDATDVSHMATSRDTSTSIITAFFRVLQKGKNVVLYSYTDGLKSRFFIAEVPDYTIKELGYRLYYNYSGNDVSGQKGVTVNENIYMKQLFALANKYGALDDNLQREIEHASYIEDDLLGIVNKINNISKEEFEKSNKSKGPIFNVFIGAGINLNSINTPQTSSFTASGGKSYSSTGFAGTAGVNFFVNPTTRQFQLRVELGVAQSQFRDLYTLKVSPYIPFKASFDELAFNVSPQIIYNFYNAENFKVYGGAGLTLTFFKFSNSYFGSQSQPNSAADIAANDPYAFNTFNTSFLLKAGLQIHKNWGVFAQYITGALLTRDDYWALTSSCTQIGVNYYFW